jgi:hypothetical protein
MKQKMSALLLPLGLVCARNLQINSNLSPIFRLARNIFHVFGFTLTDSGTNLLAAPSRSKQRRREIITMTIQLKTVLLSAALAALILPVAAQDNTATPAQESTTSTTTPPDRKPPVTRKHKTVAERKKAQQERIAQGVKSGQLTPEEASKLEKREAKLNKETQEMREDNGGKLTPEERAKVRKQQNKLSKQIHKQKHDRQHR